MRPPQLSRTLGRLYEAEARATTNVVERFEMNAIADELFEDAERTERLERDPQANETEWEMQ